MPGLRKVTRDEYEKVSVRTRTTSLMRWCVLMVCYAYKSDTEIECHIIKTALYGE